MGIMSQTSQQLPSALHIDLTESCRLLSQEYPEHADLQAIQHYTSRKAVNDVFLDRLAALLTDEEVSLSVAARFRPLLLDLAYRLLRHNQAANNFDMSARCLHCYAQLISVFPELYDVVFDFVRETNLNGLCQAAASQPTTALNQLLLDLYRLAAASPSLLDYNNNTLIDCNWVHQIVLATNVPLATRLLALNVFALIKKLSESAKLRLQKKHFVDNTIGTSATLQSQEAMAALAYEQNPVNVWTLETQEFRTIQRSRDVLASTQVAYDTEQTSTTDSGEAMEVDETVKQSTSLSIQDLSSRVCCIGGILLSRQSTASTSTSTTASEFVETRSILPSLSDVALHLSSRFPILLSGPPSCGKSSLIRHVAQLIKGDETSAGGSHLLTIQLGDQSGVDAKQLLGSFVSSPSHPGKFEWSEGALTRAVRLGKWLVLEDIDKAGSEVLSTIARLVEQLGPTKPLGSRLFIDLGSRGKVFAGEGFALFATRSVQASNNANVQVSRPSFLGSSHWSEILLTQPEQQDVEFILQSKFPQLASRRANFVDRLVQTWYQLQRATLASTAGSSSRRTQQNTAVAGSVRAATLRDLIKWVTRVERLMAGEVQLLDPLTNPLLQEECFIEACDIFLGSVPPPAKPTTNSGKAVDRYSALVQLLAEELGLSAERAWWTLRDRKPELSVRSSDAVNGNSYNQNDSPSRIKIGRCELPRRSRAAAKRAPSISRQFAMTKPSLLLLEQLTVASALAEPVLLVGETGTGKTTVIQHLASLLGQPITALNLSQQTESGDLLGAFKPLDPKVPATELHDLWSSLFARTFSARRNARFVDAERKAFLSSKWSRVAGLWRESFKMAMSRKKEVTTAPEAEPTKADTSSRKKRRTDRGVAEGSPAAVDDARAEASLDQEWQTFDHKAREFAIQHAGKKKNLVFSFVEGPLVKALRNGDWILLDEINLAAAETLDGLTGLLQSSSSSVTLTERGDLEPIPRHPNFRLFACMNPATDVGKKDLPPNLRSRFTELYVPSPDSDREALTSIVDKYIGEHALGDRGAVLDVAECYSEIRRLANNHELADGANQRPHFSIRTLARALTFATDIAPQYGLRRSLWEGFIMAFTLLLDANSARVVRALIETQILAKAKNARAIATFVPPAPKEDAEGKYVQVGPFWLPTGPLPLDTAEDYILTPSVQSKLVGLSRAALTRRFPVLVQGPTSAGKTSAVEYLARRTGHRFVRINNHEHTDIQEYIGSYASDPDTGKLSFQEGLLVKALRRGDWIVLDELNLAPTDVLEALNRLLDDNRELVIPETGEVVKPHPHFMLFATQNPPGLYAGRKVLSRAFRNRFLELHFDDVPRAELETILTNRCKIAPSYASRIVGVFEELQKRRQAGRVFDTKQAFVTLRDLFRWGNRDAMGYQQLAENGYMLIAERARRNEDKETVKEVIEKIMKVTLDVNAMYNLDGADAEAALARMGADLGSSIIQTLDQSTIVRTSAFQRLVCLVATSLRYNEPVLLVGETGAGKTSVCEVLAASFGRELHSVNCHQNTDTSDLLGGQRPLRNRAALQQAAKTIALNELRALSIATSLNADSKVEDVSRYLEDLLSKWPSASDDQSELDSRAAKDRIQTALRTVYQSTALFEWQDGPLVQAMRSGDHVLLDEISLADDSVLERLNSVLEPARTLILAERATSSNHHTSGDTSAQIVAEAGFQVLATMNPGGDYGKKELSPALRNRFTEIWVPHVDIRADLMQIINSQWKDQSLSVWTEPIIDYSDWFIHQVGGRDQSGLGLRDLLTWASFMNTVSTGQQPAMEAALGFAHGASLTIIDGLGALPATAAMSNQGLAELKRRCLSKLKTFIQPVTFDQSSTALHEVHLSEERLEIGPFSIVRGDLALADNDGNSFSFGAKTSASNAMRVMRALCVPNKSVLLEGSPGAGKTSLVTALAKAASRPLTRINLSDQTELTDLFGSDMPLEGGGPGEFAWRDAAFLTAMQTGQWVLLDEMNLASQTVLEGLNSCLDHRGTVYVPELGRSFEKHPEFRIFAAQNPHHQGGGRKGLPKSFLNRFVKVHIEELTADDILAISGHLYPEFDQEKLARMIRFNFDLHYETVVRHSFGRIGAPWEFNLRDLLRWLDLLHSNLGFNVIGDPVEHLASLYIQRFRTSADRRAARELYRKAFDCEPLQELRLVPTVTPDLIRVGHAVMERQQIRSSDPRKGVLLQGQYAPLETLIDCVQKQWLSILVGPTGVGKTTLVRLLAQLAGARLEEIPMSSGTDTMDLIGTFEQYDPHARLRDVLARLLLQLDQIFERITCDYPDHLVGLMSALDTISSLSDRFSSSIAQISTDEAEVEIALMTLRSVAATLSDSVLVNTIEEVKSAFLDQVQTSEETKLAPGRFEWIEGPLLKALREGHWLLLDNANLCSASVLDRLNSLFETNGTLVVSERGIVDGEVPIVRPHPNFRVFMCLDPRHGELSRAMRNRGIEIAMLDQSDIFTSDAERLRVLCGINNTRGLLPPTVQRLHSSMQKSLMLDTIASQELRRGLTTAAEVSPWSEGVPAHRVVSWAASQLVLCNSALASATLSLSASELISVDSTTKGSFLIRNSSQDAEDLLHHMLASAPAPADNSANCLALLQEWRQVDGRNLAMPDTSPLVNSGRVSGSMARMMPNDLRYEPHLLRLLSATACSADTTSLLDVLLRSMLHAVELKDVVERARGTKARDLSIFERSATIQGVVEGQEDEITATVRYVYPLAVAISAAVRVWAQKLPPTANSSTIQQLSTLLRYAGFLETLCSAAELDFSSVQILVRSMSDLLRDLEMSCQQSSADLSRAISVLGGSLKLTSGHAFHLVWNLFGANRGMHANVSRILADEIALLPTASKDILRNALDLAATLQIANTESCSPQEGQELLQLGWQTLKLIRSEGRKADLLPEAVFDASSRQTESLLLSAVEISLKSLQAGSGSDNERLKIFIRLLDEVDAPSMLTASISAKAAHWTASKPEIQSRLLHSDFSWIQRLWSAEHSSGPAELLRPVLLKTLLETRSGSRSLQEKARHDRSVKRLLRSAGVAMTASSPSRSERMREMLAEYICLVSRVLLSSLDQDRDLSLTTIADLHAQFMDAAKQKTLSDNSSAMVSEWTAFLLNTTPMLEAAESDVGILGQCWVSLSLTMLRLYLPNVALDPIVSRRTMFSFGEYCREQIRTALALETEAEMALAGSKSNMVISGLQEELDLLDRQAAARKGESDGAWRNANLKLLSQLYREVHSFCKEVISPARMQDLTEAIRTDLNDRTVQREESLQASVLSFAARLRKTFSSLRDIVEPINASLLQLQLGFRIMIQAAQTASSESEVGKRSEIVKALVSFPTTRSCQLFQDLRLPFHVKSKSSDITAPLLIISAASVSCDRTLLGDSTMQSPETLQYISRAYEQIFQLWTLDRERNKIDEEEATSLYKSRKIEESIELDADAEEKEFMALFPEYDDDVLDTPSRPYVRRDDVLDSSEKEKKTLLPSSLFVPILHVHSTNFGAKKTKQNGQIFESHREELINKLLRKHYENWSEDLDKAGAAYGLFMAIADSEAAGSCSNQFNFYLDPRPSETRKATVIVEELRDRLTALISEWPEQMVLQHIRDRCDAVLRLDANSPVARILSALEQLLTHTEDWEGFASSATSIQSNRERISAQLIEWRRLELSCWAELLNFQAQTFEDGVAEWWFRIYEILIRGTRAAASEGPDALKQHIEKLIDAVDQFVRSSPLGQFEVRLSLLESYATFMDSLVRFAPRKESTGFEETRLVLQNVTSFFRQFGDRISTTLQTQRAVLEKSITGFIKLASWKDINIHALKTSAAKTHRQLHKTIRKFRDVLRQPVDPILAAHLDALSRKDMPKISHAELPRRAAVVRGSTWAEVTQAVESTAPEHIRNLAKTLTVLQKMTTEKLLPTLLSPVTGLAISDFSDEIIDRQQQLAKLTPAFAKEDNEKAIKNLTARKRKAWNDLIKELRRIGLSSFAKTDLVTANQSLTHVYTQPLLLSACPASLRQEPFADLEQFYFRLLATLPKVRGSLQEHSPDLATAELQRGINYIEHVTSLVLNERGRIFSQLKTLSTLEEAVSRLQFLHMPGADSLVRVVRATPFATLASFLARLEAGLDEILTKAPGFVRASAFTSNNADGFLARLSSARSSLTQHRQNLERISRNVVPGCTLFFLTEKEQSEMEAAEQHVSNIEQCLVSGQEEVWALESLLQPTRTWLVEELTMFDDCRSAMKTAHDTSMEPSKLSKEVDVIISSILQIAQDVKGSYLPKTTDGETDDLPDRAIQLDLQRLEKQQAYLRSESILSSVLTFLSLAQSMPSDQNQNVHAQLARVYPFVHEYCELLRGHVVSSANLSKCLLKLDHVLCNLVSALASKGFCKPPEEQKDEDGQGEGDEELEGGTGLADGSGAKDITDQMDDEDEIEELQKDDPLDQSDDGDEKTEREKNAKEVEQDFGGEMEDISADEDDNDDGEEQDDDDAEPEEAVGDVDPLDPNAVDEKMWDGNDDKDDEPSDAKDKTEKDLGGEENNQPQSEDAQKPDKSSAADDTNQSKEQAGEKADDQDNGEKQKPDDQNVAEDGENQPEGQEEQPGSGEEDGDDQEESGGEEEEDAELGAEGGGRQMDQEADQGENLDLNDDIDMDGDSQKGDGDSDEDMDDLSDLDQPPDEHDIDRRPENKELDDMVEDEPAAEDNAERAGDEAEVGDEQADEEPVVSKEDGEDAMEDDEDDEVGQEEGDVPRTSDQTPQTAGKSTVDQADPFDLDAADLGADEGGQEESANQQQSTRSKQGRRVEAQNQNKDAEDGQQDQEDASDSADQPDTADQAGSRGTKAQNVADKEQTSETEPQADQKDEMNPMRSMGDALEEFRRRIEEIQAAREDEEEILGDQAKQDGEGMPEQGEVEHVAHDENAESQALGAAKEQDELQKLGDLGIEDQDETTEGKPRGEDVKEEDDSEQRGPQPLPEQPEQQSEVKRDGQQKAFMPSDIKPSSITAEKEAILDKDGDANEADDDVDTDVKEEEEEDMTPMPDETRENVDLAIQDQLELFRAVESSEERLTQAGDLWRSYASLTADLAFSLCEQLRLVLAPTLATRLNGDFRTGKRLNMRKIVPFIASDFAKDKIWLRRTKPSSREYQVMLAIDDSRSMSESRSAHLAYQTLALVTGALSRLEVGDVSICRFGEEVESLHDFGKGTFNDQNGAHVIDKLGFQQKGTNVLKLVEKSLDSLAEARASRSSSSASQAADLWQLEIIISDGICQDHAKLRSLLRRAAEQRVMLVFVVIDSLQQPSTASGSKQQQLEQQRSSILEMNNVSYYTDVNGKLQLKMERYMDTFPFEYYVVVREVEALPEVLSATLRQWVEKIRETET